MHLSASLLLLMARFGCRPFPLPPACRRDACAADAEAILSSLAASQHDLQAQATLVCLPLIGRSSTGSVAAAPVGTLTLCYASPPDGQALQRILQVAEALATEQHQALRGFAALVSSIIQPHRLHAGSSTSSSEIGSGDDLDGWEGASSSGELSEGEEDEAGGNRSVAARAAASSLTLRFKDPGLQLAYEQYAARSLQRVDTVAYLLCAVLFR